MIIEIKNYKQVLKAIMKGDYIRIGNIPDEFVTEKLCIEAVKHWPYEYVNIPDEFVTEKLCIEAVKEWPSAIKYIPDEFKTEKLKLLHENLWVL